MKFSQLYRTSPIDMSSIDMPPATFLLFGISIPFKIFLIIHSYAKRGVEVEWLEWLGHGAGS